MVYHRLSPFSWYEFGESLHGDSGDTNQPLHTFSTQIVNIKPCVYIDTKKGESSEILLQRTARLKS